MHCPFASLAHPSVEADTRYRWSHCSYFIPPWLWITRRCPSPCAFIVLPTRALCSSSPGRVDPSWTRPWTYLSCALWMEMTGRVPSLSLLWCALKGIYRPGTCQLLPLSPDCRRLTQGADLDPTRSPPWAGWTQPRSPKPQTHRPTDPWAWRKTSVVTQDTAILIFFFLVL